MADRHAVRQPLCLRISPSIFVLSMMVLALPLTGWHLAQTLPPQEWVSALGDKDRRDIPVLLFLFSDLPRIAISLLAGAALGLAATLFQQVLRNPLAEPSTLGVANGAQFALVVAYLWQPWLLDYSREAIALTGALAAAFIVFITAQSGGRSPISLIMAGMVTNMTLGAVSSVAILFNHEYLAEIFVWQSGRLDQSGWSQVTYLAPRVVTAFVLSIALVRPLALFDLGDEGAQSAGLRLTLVRPTVLLLAIALSASVVAAVGVLAFVGLAVPALVRLSGARTLRDRLLWAPFFGAGILLLADQVVQQVPLAGTVLPAGVATALLGAPLLLLLLPRLRSTALPPMEHASSFHRVGLTIFGGIGVLLAVLSCALFLGKTASGWSFASLESLDVVIRWRGARVLAALSAGILLGLAGTLIQRLTGNPLASPEVLGISAGASLGAIALAAFVPGYDLSMLMSATAGSAGLTLLAILLLSRGAEYSPQRMILAGVALGTIVAALAELLLASGGTARTDMLAWMSGSTYRATWETALAAGGAAFISLLFVPLLSRWLDILPIGAMSARALGIDLRKARGLIVIATALMTGVATIVIGPLSFVGLVAPHLARAIGMARALPQMSMAALAGGVILVFADWAGRLLIFPWQIPAGLLAALIGGPYFLVLMWRRS